MKEKTKINTFLLISILLLVAGNACGQTKYEKESRLKLEEVPAKARQFVDSLHFEKKVDWYYEQNLKGNSIEAKSKIKRKKYSIEFDTLGNIQDVEMIVDGKEVPTATFNAICTILHDTYDSFQINKIQVQYTGDPATLLSLAKNQTTQDSYTTNYELVVKGKKDKQVNLYEITFTQAGQLIAISEIIFSNTDNLEY